MPTLHPSDLKCPKCGSGAVEVSGVDIYPHRPDLAKLRFYRCFAGCDCHAGTHGDGRPKAQLADFETRAARIDAHHAFDRVWKSGQMKRTTAYRLLAEFHGKTEVHIGWMSIRECRATVRWSKRFK